MAEIAQGTRLVANGTASVEQQPASSLELKVDVDQLTVDGFIALLELQEQMGEQVMAKHIKGMIDLLKPCVVNVDVGTLPYRHMQAIMETVIAELSDGGTAAGN